MNVSILGNDICFHEMKGFWNLQILHLRRHDTWSMYVLQILSIDTICLRAVRAPAILSTR
jgi:hypothetical protein